MGSEQSEYRANKQKVDCYVLCIDVIKISHKKKFWERIGVGKVYVRGMRRWELPTQTEHDAITCNLPLHI